MGVPKFFRYISERYPNLSELVGIKELPQFDNMYLDMNGIIHNCSHPDDSNVHFRISEEQIFRDIFHYIDTLFRLIQPTNLFFMAVDGVAPRAKMNQQRGRRFRSAKEAADLIEKAKKAGEKLPEESRFDSNCITPGTEFMVRLQEAMKHFVKTKISTDIGWQNCTIILSGHETPGEGEHKIMEYIRYLKASPDYDPNTRHCLYGLDADLMMLGLCTHELQFSLLREEVKFDKKAKRATSVDDTRFYLLHLGLLREYLEMEFINVKDKLQFDYDIEKIIDDWIFMCFMVGNDFIPHLPNLHINSDALPTLYRAYCEVLPQMDGYINEGGQLNLPRLEKFMGKLGTTDRELFRQHYTDIQNMEYDNKETFEVDLTEMIDPISAGTKSDLEQLIKNTMLDFGSDEESDGDEKRDAADTNGAEDLSDEDLSDDELFEREFLIHKRNYYIEKMKYPEMTEEVLAEQTECYITALQWTLSYYYRGVCSWGWFYPHHYAPYISDIKNFKDLAIRLEMGKPFLPFQQLLAVLPSASREHLPKAYHNMMTQPDSPLIDYYPVDFETDLNGKKQEWEAVVLIPFIDEKRLLDAMKDCANSLTPHEKNRNIHGPMLRYDYTEADLGVVPETPYAQSAIHHNHCAEQSIWRDDIRVSDDKLVLGPSHGALTNVYFPGFPTMRHLKYTASVQMKRIKVFEQPSRNESMVIKIQEPEEIVELKTLATNLLGKEVFVGWPHLREAKVVAVSNAEGKIDKHGYTKYEDRSREFTLLVKHMIDHHTSRMGIDLGDVTQLVHVTPLKNLEYSLNIQGPGKLFLMKKWSPVEIACAPHAIVKELGVQYEKQDACKKIEDVYAQDSVVFMLKTFYGSQGRVLEPLLPNGRLKVSILAHPEPDFSDAKNVYYDDCGTYTNSYNCGTQIGINNRLFAKITGTVLVVPGQRRFPLADRTSKTNIGLQLKFPKTNEEVAEFTRHEDNQWLYSQKTIDLVKEYMLKFPALFTILNRSEGQNDFIFESDIEAINKRTNEHDDELRPAPKLLTQITKWLKEQSHQKALRRNIGSDALNKATVKQVLDAVQENKKKPVKCMKLQVRPHMLYKPNLNAISVSPDASATYELFDRVVIARMGYSVPLGAKGTIISIQPLTDSNPVRQENINAVEYFYDVLFDEPFEGGTSIDGVIDKSVFKVRQSVLLNITYGLESDRDKKMPQNNKNRNANFNDNKNQAQSNAVIRGGNGDNAGNNQASYSQILARNPKNTNQTRATPNNWRDNNNQHGDNVRSIKKQNNNENWRENNSNKKENNTESINKSNVQMPIQQMSELQVGPIPFSASTDDSSDALRKLLGISSTVQTTKEPHQPHTTPLDLNTIFSLSNQTSSVEQILPIVLPKPPENWRLRSNDVKDTKDELFTSKVELHSQSKPQQSHAPLQPAQLKPNQQTMHQHLPTHPQLFPLQPPPYMIPPNHNGPFMPPSMQPPMHTPFNNHGPAMHVLRQPNQPVPHNQMPPFVHGMNLFYGHGQGHLPPAFSNRPDAGGPKHNNSFGHIQRQQPPQQQHQQMAYNHQGPNGPHMLNTNNSKYMPGHGAFIPLQAARKNVKPKSYAEPQAVIDRKSIKRIQDVPQSNTEQNVNNAPHQTETIPMKKEVKDSSKARPKRLAANFNPPTAPSTKE